MNIIERIFHSEKNNCQREKVYYQKITGKMGTTKGLITYLSSLIRCF